MDNKRNIDNLTPWNKGNDLTADHLDEPRQVFIKQAATAPPSQVTRNPLPQMNCQMFRVFEVQKDYIVCYVADSNGTSEEITHIAMPYILQQTHYEDRTTNRRDITYVYDAPIAGENTVRRTATNADAEEEIQVIVPSYEVDDIIVGFVGLRGGTNVNDVEDEPIMWMDLNIDGRMWAKDASPPE